MSAEDIFNILFLTAQTIETATANARIASAITLKREIVSIGLNQMKSHPFQKRFGKDPRCIFLHSEVAAIHKSLRRVGVEELRKCTLYVCRAKRDGRNGPFVSGLARPCLGCMGAIAAFGIKKVFYSIDNEMRFACL